MRRASGFEVWRLGFRVLGFRFFFEGLFRRFRGFRV